MEKVKINKINEKEKVIKLSRKKYINTKSWIESPISLLKSPATRFRLLLRAPMMSSFALQSEHL